MAGECDGTGKSEQIAEADAGEEVPERRSGWCCEEKQAGEGEERPDGGGPAWRRGVWRAQRGNDGE